MQVVGYAYPWPNKVEVSWLFRQFRHSVGTYQRNEFTCNSSWNKHRQEMFPQTFPKNPCTQGKSCHHLVSLYNSITVVKKKNHLAWEKALLMLIIITKTYYWWVRKPSCYRSHNPLSLSWHESAVNKRTCCNPLPAWTAAFCTQNSVIVFT